MASSHLKRIVAPKTWPILRKTTKFVTRPKPNGQSLERTLPVVVIMRELLAMVQTAQQAKTILRTVPVTVNGKRIYDTDSAVGFMDLLVINGNAFRVMITTGNTLSVIPAKDQIILQKIVGKTSVAKGKTQINCSSGRTLIVTKDEYKTGDSIALTQNKITAHYPLGKGACVLLTGGSHIGKVGHVDEIDGQMITITAEGQSFTTAKRHAYVVGTQKPAIALT